jgi:hypothetical protein
MLCGMFGISPDQAFALSLIKRAADLVVGLLALSPTGSGRKAGQRNYSRHLGYRGMADSTPFLATNNVLPRSPPGQDVGVQGGLLEILGDGFHLSKA